MGTQVPIYLEGDVAGILVPHLQPELNRVREPTNSGQASENEGVAENPHTVAMPPSTLTATIPTAADPQFPPETPRTPPTHSAPPVTRIAIRDNEITRTNVRSSTDYSNTCDCGECFAVVFLSFSLFLLLCLFTPSLLVIAVLDELVRVPSYLTRVLTALVYRSCCCLRQQSSQSNVVPAGAARERLVITVLREVLGFEVGLAAPYTPSTEEFHREFQMAIESIEDRDADPIKFTDEEADKLASEYLSMEFLCPISTSMTIDTFTSCLRSSS